jgi:hypothetical protein
LEKPLARDIYHFSVTDSQAIFWVIAAGIILPYLSAGMRGVYAAKASLDLLRTNQHPLAELNNAMQAIITEYRILDSSPN